MTILQELTESDSASPTIEDLKRELAESHERLKLLADRYELRIIEAEKHHRLLTDELNHRVRNMLQVVSGLSAQTIRRSESLELFAASFQGRIRALANAYELLSDANWSKVSLDSLIRREVVPHAQDPGSLTLTGPDLMLSPKAALAFSLILHELSTNAVKHGALSWPEGRVGIDWRVETDRSRLILKWVETAGPGPMPSTKNGFGSELISRQLRYELDGELHYDFMKTGLTVTIVVPLDDHLFSLPEAA